MASLRDGAAGATSARRATALEKRNTRQRPMIGRMFDVPCVRDLGLLLCGRSSPWTSAKRHAKVAVAADIG